MKISVSVPPDLFARLEGQRKKRGWTRSRVIQEAVEHWLRSGEVERARAAYIAGYLREPEDAGDSQALLRAQLEGVEPEDWT